MNLPNIVSKGKVLNCSKTDYFMNYNQGANAAKNSVFINLVSDDNRQESW